MGAASKETEARRAAGSLWGPQAPSPRGPGESVRLRTGLCFPYSPVLASPSSAHPAAGSSPTPQVPKGQGCACSGRFPLPPRGSRGLLSRWAQKSPWRTQLLGMQCRETHAFLFSFPKNKVAPFVFPSLFFLKAAYGFLPR